MDFAFPWDATIVATYPSMFIILFETLWNRGTKVL